MNNFLKYIDIINNNSILLLGLKILFFMIFVIIFIIVKGTVKKIIAMIALLILLSSFLLLKDITTIVAIFFILFVIVIGLYIFLLLKENETKFIIMNKINVHSLKITNTQSFNSQPISIKENIKQTNINEVNNTDSIINNEILDLYSEVEKEQYRYELFTRIGGKFKKLIKIRKNAMYYLNFVFLNIKIILILIMIMNFVLIITIINSIMHMNLYFRFTS